MNTRASIPTLALAAGCLLLGSTGGAVAGGLITGKDIKNESVTGKDIKNESLTAKDLSPEAAAALRGATGQQGASGAPGSPGAPGAPGVSGVSGWELATAQKSVAASTGDWVTVQCSPGRVLLGAAGSWASSPAAVQVVFQGNQQATAFTSGVPIADSLIVQATCATLSGGPRPAPTSSGKSAR